MSQHKSVSRYTCCACADERLRGTKVCDREGNLKPDTHFIFSTLPDSSLVAEGQPALKLALPTPCLPISQASLVHHRCRQVSSAHSMGCA